MNKLCTFLAEIVKRNQISHTSHENKICAEQNMTLPQAMIHVHGTMGNQQKFFVHRLRLTLTIVNNFGRFFTNFLYSKRIIIVCIYFGKK